MHLLLAVTQVAVNATYVTLITATIIPLLVALITKINASPKVKALVMVVLNAIAALITSSIVSDGSAVIDLSQPAIIAFLLGIVTSGATYLTVWKPLKTTDYLEVVTGKTGIGGDKAGATEIIDFLKLMNNSKAA